MKYYSFKQIAEMFSITRSTIYVWQREGKIKITYINDLPRVSQEEVDRLTGKIK